MYVNENIKRTKRVFPMQGRYGYLRHDMNENPEGLPKEFVDSVLREITPEFLATYPEPNRFHEKYAAYIGMEPSCVLATNGSDMAIRYLLETFGEQGKDVVTVSPSFEMYWVNCSILGLRHRPVAYRKDLTIDVREILDAITTDTRVVVLLNPNNPVGNVYTSEEAEAVVRRADEAGAMVIIDEAYHYFYDQTFLPLLEKYRNIAVLRTFSKLFSIPACRLGVLIGSPEVVRYIRNAKLTFDVNAIALLFGERILERPDMIDRLISEEKEGKSYALRMLEERGYRCRDCMGNYILLEPKRDPREVEAGLKAQRVLVHAYSNELLAKYIRVSVGSRRAMKIFLDVFFAVDDEAGRRG